MRADQISALIALIHRAGAEVVRLYEAGAAVRRKDDGSPVTAADEAAEAILVAGLQALDPCLAIVSEEQNAAGARPDLGGGRYWCVDPIDGTKEFVNRTGEFTLCIGYIEGDRAVGGVLYAPILNRTFVGLAGWGAVEVMPDGSHRPLTGRPRPADGAVALVSRSHHDGGRLSQLLADEAVTEQRVMGSALKFGLLAAGEADLTARLGPTCEWDTCAGQAILEAAGGQLRTLDGRPLRYGKPKYLNPGFIAYARS